MASEGGPRRSSRIQKLAQVAPPVVTSFIDTSEIMAPPPKRRRHSAPFVDEMADLKDSHGIAVETPPSAKRRRVKKTVKVEDLDGAATVATLPKAKPRKRKAVIEDRSWHEDAAEARIARTTDKIRHLREGQTETRLRAYVDEPGTKYINALKKAQKERMFIIDRERTMEDNCHAHHTDCPRETLKVAGSKGNVYTVAISHLPSCTCPVGIFTRKREEACCKHVLYVLHHVLKVPNAFKRQNAFLTQELRDMFDNAPAMPSEVADDSNKDGNRKPVEDDCPICCMEFEAEDEVVWCRAACGNNVHKACFDQWANSKAYGSATCPFCRTPWQFGDGPKKIYVGVAKVDMPTARGENGYVNVRHLLDYEG